ncbi:MAG TPA: tetratricopeptide repeat protein [Rhizomicrobium sp.]|jgi:predicted TPR repeat methyltransferase
MRFFLTLALALPLAAQAAPPPAAQHAKPKNSLDQLFTMLARAQSEEDAKPIEAEIGALFEQSGSPTVDLLMGRVAAAIEAGDKETARHLIDSITDIAPDFAEAWHRRAVIQEDDGDDEGAMISLQRVIKLNPRQFEAYSELGAMLEDYGDKKAALAAFRKALTLDPQMEGAAKHVEALTRSVEGEKI